MSTKAEVLEERLARELPDDDAPDARAGKAPGGVSPAGGDGARGPSPRPVEGALPEPRLNFVAGAAALAAIGGAWMVGGLFRTPELARAIGIVGVAIGAGLTWLSLRTRRSVLANALVVPVAAIVGAAFLAPAATGGTANLPSLVVESLRDGGLLQPPVPFAAGWRFLLTVLFAVVAATGVGLAVSLRRARLAVAVAMPALVAGALLQPKGAELASVAVAGAFVLASLALAYGADLPTGDSLTSGFEARRLLRGAGLVAGLLVVLAVVAQAGFLFPAPDNDRVVPPQRPASPPPEPDRVLFHVDGAARGPWRVGVLDTYDGEAFLLPPIDPSRLTKPRAGGVVAASRGERATTTARFVVTDLRGATLPAPASATAVRAGDDVRYDPRTEVFRLAGGRPRRGYAYSVTAQVGPTGRQLAAVLPSVDPTVAAFTKAPPVPNEVVTLLNGAPPTPFDRLQFIRQALYNNVVAAGAGTPSEVTPARVAAMLRPGAEATPFEITAAEVLLARFAGVPARLGFGFYGGEAPPGAQAVSAGLDFRPKHGAAWLEAWFDGYGWTPLVGTPPKAKAGLDDQQKNLDDNVRATDDLALVVFVPVELSTVQLVYEKIRLWAATAIPLVVAVLLLAASWPMLAKFLRRRRRQRWAAARGPTGRIWAAYVEFRDKTFDLNVGDTSAPPLEFCDHIAEDEEHRELAWLVTRSVWGDLRRDLSDADADAAEAMARSVSRRVTGAQPAINRLVGLISKASLRAPFAADLPNVGRAERAARVPAPTLGLADASGAGGLASASRAGRLARRVGRGVWQPRSAIAVVVVAILVAVPVVSERRSAATSDNPPTLSDRLVPERVGQFTVVREHGLDKSYRLAGGRSLAARGAVYTFQDGPLVAGSYQAVALRRDIDTSKFGTRGELLQGVLTGSFNFRQYGTTRLWVLRTSEQQVFVWFPPTRNVMNLWVFRGDVRDARVIVQRVIAYQLALPDSPPASATAPGALVSAEPSGSS